MKILLDENVPRPVAESLEKVFPGSILHASDIAGPGMEDDRIYEIACRDRYLLVTFDSDFLNVFRYPPRATRGIVVVRPKGFTIAESGRKLLSLLLGAAETIPEGSLVVITRSSVRVMGSGGPGGKDG